MDHLSDQCERLNEDALRVELLDVAPLDQLVGASAVRPCSFAHRFEIGALLCGQITLVRVGLIIIVSSGTA